MLFIVNYIQSLIFGYKADIFENGLLIAFVIIKKMIF